MIFYILRRIVFLPVVLVGLSLMIFGMQMLLSPTQRLALYAPNPEHLKGGEAYIKTLIELYGLNKPFYLQYARWLTNVFQGNLGWSQTARMPVWQALWSYFPATAELALVTIPAMVLGAILLGAIAATHHNRVADHFVRVLVIVGWSLPAFVFGSIGLMIFYGALRWFPPGRLSLWGQQIVNSPTFVRFTGLNTLDALLNGNVAIFGDALQHLILPASTLAFGTWAGMARIMRSSMLETLRQEYVHTAYAKGLPQSVVHYRHALRNALLPVITVAGIEVAYLFGGVVITETIFDYPGMGRFAANAAVNLDFPAVLGFALFFGFLLVLINLFIDICYVLLDPRVRYE